MGLKANEGKAKYMIVKGNKEQTTRIMDYTHIFDTVHGYANYRLGEQGIETRSEWDFPHPCRPNLGPTKPAL